MDLILTNGKIYTMDKNRTVAEAMAVEDHIIRAVGSTEEILNLKKDNTIIYDLEGKTLLPGFNDSHMHLVNYGYSLTQVNLIGISSIGELNKRVSHFIDENKIEEGRWIRGRGWNQDYFTGEKRFPSRYDLDKISATNPIVVTRACGHVVVVNSKALEVLNIGKETEQIEGGQFDLDENGEPTGVFRENAVGLVYDNLPTPTIEEIKDMMRNAIRDMNKAGITSVGTDDFEALPDRNYENILKAYKELKEENKLNIRIYEQCLLSNIDKLQGFIDKGYRTSMGDNLFKIGPLKLLIDGSLGARTAALMKPYSDDPNTVGITTATDKELYNLVDLAHRNNIQVAIHGIGDKAMYMAFSAIEKSLKNSPKENHRHGIVHCQITDEYLLDKFKELNAIAYIQPIFLDYDWKIVRDRVGEAREKTSYNWKTMVNKGVAITCGSDSPVETFDVMKGIYEAVTRKDLDGNPKDGWLPEQKLTVDEAVYGYTMGGAYASFEEDIKGSLEVDKLADMVLLSEDIFNIDEEDIKNVDIHMTILGGKIVYI
ncbi:amidohydrolase [Tissierella pigra]|uniref:amidohydrolase n=1 Tax=Tissierella pigra TaxID=2607614 RepID=UPI001C10A4FA|nr:amidohydrolase [Tissierella pigra]MBU5427894.1 amidohydrolase [Tissierella pigra]